MAKINREIVVAIAAVIMLACALTYALHH